MAEWGQFDVLGHLTLPLRYLNENRGWNLSMERFGWEITEIFSILKQKGIGIELNTNRGGTPLPDEMWLRLYEDMAEDPIVTLGTDAHAAQFVGCAVREAATIRILEPPPPGPWRRGGATVASWSAPPESVSPSPPIK